MDRPEAKTFMDIYFARIRELSQNKKLSSRIRFMLQDLMELRSDNWVPRRAAAGPKTIAEIHKDAEKAKAEAEALRRSQSSGGRGMPPMQYGDRRAGGRDRRDSVNKDQKPSIPSDGWNTVGAAQSGSALSQARKASDLSGFGVLNRAKQTTSSGMGPGGSTFFGSGAKGREDASTSKIPPGYATVKGQPVSKAAGGLASNAFSALMESSEMATSPPEAAPVTPTERPRLKLLPRGSTLATGQEVVENPLPVTTPTTTTSSNIPTGELRKRIENLVKEYYAINDVNEVILSLKEFGSNAAALFVEVSVDDALNRTLDDVNRMASLYGALLKEEVVKTETFDTHFKTVVPMLEDIMLDSPHADKYLALLMVGAKLPLFSAIKSVEAKDIPKCHVKFLAEFLKAMKATDLDTLKKDADANWSDLKKVLGKTDENVAEVLEKNDIFEISPALVIVGFLHKNLGSLDADRIITWFEVSILMLSIFNFLEKFDETNPRIIRICANISWINI